MCAYLRHLLGTTPFLLDIYQGSTNTHGKIGGQKVVTSASVYVRMGRFTSVFIVFYRSKSNTQNLIPIAMCRFKGCVLTKIWKLTVNVVVSGYGASNKCGVFAGTYFHVRIICMCFIERIGFYIHELRVLLCRNV